jgi:hypothetical protein
MYNIHGEFLIMTQHNKYEFLAHHLCCDKHKHQKHTKYNEQPPRENEKLKKMLKSSTC